MFSSIPRRSGETWTFPPPKRSRGKGLSAIPRGELCKKRAFNGSLEARLRNQVGHAAGRRIRLRQSRGFPFVLSDRSRCLQEGSLVSSVLRHPRCLNRRCALALASSSLPTPRPHWPSLGEALGIPVTGIRKWARCTQGRESDSEIDTWGKQGKQAEQNKLG